MRKFTRLCSRGAVACLLLATSMAAGHTDPPTDAPAPRPKKTTAELLVGKWRIVREGETVFPAGGPTIGTYEFMADGRFRMSLVDGNKNRQANGTYNVASDTLSITIESYTIYGRSKRTDTIVTITDKSLILTSSGLKKKQAEFERVKSSP